MNDWPPWPSWPSEPGWGNEQRKYAGERFRHGNLGLSRLWIYYFGIGGDADEWALDAYLHGLASLEPGQMKLVDAAIDELNAEGRTGPVGGKGL